MGTAVLFWCTIVAGAVRISMCSCSNIKRGPPPQFTLSIVDPTFSECWLARNFSACGLPSLENVKCMVIHSLCRRRERPYRLQPYQNCHCPLGRNNLSPSDVKLYRKQWREGSSKNIYRSPILGYATCGTKRHTQGATIGELLRHPHYKSPT